MGKLFPIDLPDSLNRMHDDGVGNYWFYHKGSFPTQEPLLYQSLVSRAQSYIEIWEPYFNVAGRRNRDQDIFSFINPNITIKILTQKGFLRNSTYLADVQNAMKVKIVNSLNVRFGLRVFNLGDVANQGHWFCHDRFLIIDQSEVYIVGSSIGWHLDSHESTGMLKVHNIEAKAFIISLFNEYWKKAVTHEIPVQFLHP